MNMQPAIVIVHGAWHIPAHYQEVVDQVNQKGYADVHCPRLPSATETLPLPVTANLEHDTATIQSTIKSLVDDGRDVVVLMHSYGGVAGNNAMDGLLAPQRKALKLPGGVVHLVYMAAFVQPAGSRLVDPFNGQMMPWLDEDVQNEIVHMQDARHAFYEHVESDEEAQKWLDMTVMCPASVVKDAQTYAPYEHVGHGVDATYLVCSRDKELKVPIQEAMASLLGPTVRIEYSDAGHCCMIGYGETIASVVDRAWKTSKERIDSDR